MKTSNINKMDCVKDYLAPKCFSVFAFITSVCYVFCGAILTGITRSIASEENQKFSCNVETGKSFIETSCFSKYQQTYNSPMPFYGYVILSFGITSIVSCIYSLCVKSRVERVELRTTTESTDATNHANVHHEISEATDHTSYVFNSYICQLLTRFFFGIMFTVLQFEVFYTRKFQSEFNCVLSSTYKNHPYLPNQRQFIALNSTSVMCLDATASEKSTFGFIVAGLHVFFSFIALIEVLYLLRRLRSSRVSGILFNNDTEFIRNYFLRIQRSVATGHRELQNDSNTDTVDSKEVYKNAILSMPFPFDINYGTNTNLNEMFVDLVIQTKRAEYNFGREMKKHEIHDVYMKPPPDSIKVEKIEDLFSSGSDTKGETPHRILVVGRAGIGKTILTRKIQYDWVNDVNEFYQGKILFYFKFRWFNMEGWNNMTLKEFLRHGTAHVLSNADFENIFEEISEDPSKAILIFDGLDESNLDLSCLEVINAVSNDPTLPMSAVNLFLKLLLGNLLDGATVLTTSRPNASDIYLKLQFERQVEILGFTHERIKQYVEKFCDNNEAHDMKENMWNHINNSTDLVGMCYIPVNCFIVCVSLLQCFKKNQSNDDKALPTTLTELYRGALVYFKTHHHRNMNQRTYKRTLQDLGRLAFQGVVNRQLIFDSEVVNKRMENFGILHRLPNVIFPIHVHFCFVHLSLQEFLAAVHVVETYNVDELDKFIAENCNDGKWHLVIQFVAGILGEKMKLSDCHKRCVTSFTRHLRQDFFCDVSMESKTEGVLMIKCLQEIKDEVILKQVASNMELREDNMVHITCTDLFPADWSAIVSLLTHITTIEGFYFSERLVEGSCSELAKLWHGRCFKNLIFGMCVMGASGLQDLTLSLVNTTCKLHHNHFNLTQLDLSVNYISDVGMSLLCHVFKNSNNGRCLTHLNIAFNNLTSSGVSRFFDAVGNQFNKLSSLNLSGNSGISDEGVRIVCDEMLKGHLKLTELGIYMCEVTDDSLPCLCDVLKNDQCILARLTLSGNRITDKYISMLWVVIRQDSCSLIDLNLAGNQITDTHVPLLCECLASEQCSLEHLGLFRTRITTSGKSMLVDVQQSEHCKARGLNIHL